MEKTIKQLRSKNILQKPVRTAKGASGKPAGRKVRTMCNKLMEKERIKREFEAELREAFREIRLHQEGKLELPNAQDIFD